MSGSPVSIAAWAYSRLDRAASDVMVAADEVLMGMTDRVKIAACRRGLRLYLKGDERR